MPEVGIAQPLADAFTPHRVYVGGVFVYSITRRTQTGGKLELGGAFWVADLVISGDLPVEPLSLPPDLARECRLAIKATFLPGEGDKLMARVTQLHLWV